MTTKQPIQDGLYRGRRLTWEEFYLLIGRTPPAADNDNRRNERESGVTPRSTQDQARIVALAARR